MGTYKPLRDMKKNEVLEQLYKAAEGGYIKRCNKCGSLRVYIYTDEDYFSDMTRCKCDDCGHRFAYSGMVDD